MRGSSMGLLVVGVIIILIGAANHFVMKANPIAHTSIILGIVGLIVAVVGVVMSMSGSKA